MRRPTQSLGILAIVAAVLLASGCGSDQPETKGKIGTAKPKASATAAPADALKKSTKGAEAAVRHYAETVNLALAQGNTLPLRDAALEDCARCVALADSISDTYETGGYYQGGAWTVKSVEVGDIDGDEAEADVVIDTAAGRWHKSAGEKAVKTKATTGVRQRFELAYSKDGGWRVAAISAG